MSLMYELCWVINTSAWCLFDGNVVSVPIMSLAMAGTKCVPSRNGKKSILLEQAIDKNLVIQ